MWFLKKLADSKYAANIIELFPLVPDFFNLYYSIAIEDLFFK